jgi:hypothetical protein
MQAPKFICLRLTLLPRSQPKIKLEQLSRTIVLGKDNSFGKSERQAQDSHDPEMEPTRAGSIKGVGGWVMNFIIWSKPMFCFSIVKG